MSARIVFTKKELKEAINDNVEFITVSGKLANKIHRTKVFGRCSNKTTKWEGKDSISLRDAAIVSAFTGIEIAIIIIAIGISLGIVISLWKGYDEVDVELEADPPKVRFKAKR